MTALDAAHGEIKALREQLATQKAGRALEQNALRNVLPTLAAKDEQIEALRVELARAGDYSAAITSFVKAIETDVTHVRERDVARAQLEAVREVLLDAEHEPRCAVELTWDCDCVLGDLAAALDGSDGAGGRGVPPQERVEPRPGTQGLPADSVPANATPPTEGETP